jgi:DNA-binding transcriptional LysR family regulator
MIGSLNVLGQWVRQAQVNLPGVEVVLSEMVTSDQVQALLAHELDLGLLRGQPRPEVLKSRLIHSEQLVLAVPADHPLATAESVTLQDVARYPLITYSPAQARYFYELVIATFQEAGLSPTYVQYVNQVSTILTLVDAGVGAGMVPESVSSLKLPHVRYRSVAGLLPLQVELFASWRRDNDNPALATMLQMISP